jgi:hypothetical protein
METDQPILEIHLEIIHQAPLLVQSILMEMVPLEASESIIGQIIYHWLMALELVQRSLVVLTNFSHSTSYQQQVEIKHTIQLLLMVMVTLEVNLINLVNMVEDVEVEMEMEMFNKELPQVSLLQSEMMASMFKAKMIRKYTQ